MENNNNELINIEEIKASLSENKPDIEIATPGLETAVNFEEPKRGRGRPPGSKAKKEEPGAAQAPPDEKQVEIFFNEALGAVTLDLYIEKLLKSEDKATKDEIKAFTDSVKTILNKYLPDSVKENAELLSFILVLGGVTLKRIK